MNGVPALPLAASLSEWVRFGAVLAAGLLAGQVVRWALVRAERRQGDVRGALVLGRLVRLAVVTLAVIYALAQVGVRIGPLVAAAGVGGVALAFAVRSILENFLAGILLLLRRPFRPGDEIAALDFSGTVEEVNLRTVVVRTYDGRRVFLPNGSVLSSPIVNESAFAVRRSELLVGVAYGADVEHAAEAMRSAAAEVPGVAQDPAPEALAFAFGASSVDLCLRFWHSSSTAEMWRVRHAVLAGVKRRLEAVEIPIPFEQLTVTWAGDLPESVAGEVRSPDGNRPNRASGRGGGTADGAR